MNTESLAKGAKRVMSIVPTVVIFSLVLYGLVLLPANRHARLQARVKVLEGQLSAALNALDTGIDALNVGIEAQNKSVELFKRSTAAMEEQLTNRATIRMFIVPQEAPPDVIRTPEGLL